MPRPSRCRRVCAEPRCRGFRPNTPLAPEASEASSSVQLFVEEFEAIRIIDFEKRTHEQCALQMQVSRTTATEVYERARAKIAEALVLGKPLEIAGGNYEVCGGKCARDCAGRCRWKYRQLREHIANQTEQLEGNFTMKIAIPVKNENIYQHFGMAAAFKVYTVENGEIVGTAILNQTQVDSYAGANWRYDAPDSEVMVLHTLVIDPEAKSRGLGREFAAFYEGYALAHGCRYLRIDTNARNARARRFYQKLGYAEIGVVPCMFNGIAGVQLVLLEKRLPPLRQITADEAPRLRACVQALSEHHNRVSVNFKGSYPSRPYDKTLSLFAQALEENVSRIAVIEEDSGIVGFCKVDLHGDGTGKLDYLVVLPQCRGRKYGKALMDWAMAVFSGSGVRKIEVKVVDGNDAVHLYEKYGFRMNAHILVRGE